MLTPRSLSLAALLWAACATAAHAAVSAEEAQTLGRGKLTAFGSEAAGNADGSIPPYAGKAPRAPASYLPVNPGHRPDPYPRDKPLFSITAQNAAQYADKLDGMLDVFKKYPSYRMDIYPSRRDFVYPKYVLDNTLKNATACKGTNDELKLEGCYGGIPFPIPKTGRQVMWNHLLQYTAFAFRGKTNSWVTPTSGKAMLQVRIDTFQQQDNYDPDNSAPLPSNVIYWRFLQHQSEPSRMAGGKLVILDSMDMLDVGRRVYMYLPGQRRVKLAPQLAYDTPSGDASTMDDSKGFAGALDRFDFKLIGKKEKFIMYNNFDLHDHTVCPDEKVVNQVNFPLPDCVRWELHRVWKVEATLKPEFRHAYSKRVFYWDEDVPGAGSAENYDASGQLFRMVNQLMVPFYDGEPGAGGYADPSFELDLQSGYWSAHGTVGFPGGGQWPTERFDSRIFTPDALAGSGIR